MNERDLNKREIAPKIRFETKLNDLHVTSISFERNDLYLNKVLYNSDGISSYSRVHFKNGLIELQDINPPFVISKKANNDTLKISKSDVNYYLLVTQEIEYSRN
ncbi:hypothetical protein [Flavobacterium psychrotrophum]|uniref:hypothetical protein n=1 Tax=Flavobacterium psychrotrophum TaxID=2294119 RepID=UPI000E31EB1F|nr:hypothetical protein [Flavobacterium psychrotrophum]